MNSSTISLRALEHQLSDKIASETAALQRHFDQQLAKVQQNYAASGHNTTRSSKIAASRIEGGASLSFGDGRKIE